MAGSEAGAAERVMWAVQILPITDGSEISIPDGAHVHGVVVDGPAARLVLSVPVGYASTMSVPLRCYMRFTARQEMHGDFFAAFPVFYLGEPGLWTVERA